MSPIILIFFKIDIIFFEGYNKQVMKIGNLQVGGYAALAPMAGVADRAMREICKSFGAGYCVGELTSARGISLGDKKSATLLYCGQKERPFGSQLFGNDVASMVKAVKEAEKLCPDFIDINMGCPAPKVAGHGSGSALMKDLSLAGQIISAVSKATSLPVTVKMRSGWDENSINAVSLALIAQESGAAAVTVHGRTRKQMYAPPVNLEIIKKVKESVQIPVIGNGDITSFESAKKMKEETGCDYLLVGRGAMGNPFVFEEINDGFSGREIRKRSLYERLCVMKKQIELMVEYKGFEKAMVESRKHVSYYIKGIRGAANLRKLCGEIKSFSDIDKIIENALEQERLL